MKIRTSIAFASISLLAFSTVQAAQMKQAFSYDAAGRLISVTTDGDTAQASLDERYVYDKSEQKRGQTFKLNIAFLPTFRQAS